MRKVQELQQQIQKLSREEFAELRDWFREQDSNAWKRRYRELVDGKVKGVPGPLVFGRLRAQAPLTAEQRAELDRRLDAYEADGNPGRPAEDVIEDIKKKL